MPPKAPPMIHAPRAAWEARMRRQVQALLEDRGPAVELAPRLVRGRPIQSVDGDVAAAASHDGLAHVTAAAERLGGRPFGAQEAGVAGEHVPKHGQDALVAGDDGRQMKSHN
jgi:hypothetical protein